MEIAKPRILIVESDAVIAEVLDRQLSSLGYDVLARASTGEEAIRFAARNVPDVALVDEGLKGRLDGITAAEIIRAERGSAIVFLTAHTPNDLFEKTKRAEPCGYLAKPVSPGELERTLEIAVSLHKTERRLRESERRLDLALKGANLGLWDVNLQTDEAVWNDRMAEILGYSLDELRSITEMWTRSWWFLVHPGDWDHVQDAVDRHLKGDAPFFECEHRFRMKSGDWKWVYAKGRVAEFDGQGQPLRITGTTLDISDRKRAEEEIQRALAVAREMRLAAEQATIAKSRFLANMSHELRTPLNAIIGFAEILQDQQFGTLNERQEKFAVHIADSGKHLLNLINDILDLSKIESGKMSLRTAPVRIVPFLKSCLATFKERAFRKLLELSFEFTDEIEDVVALVDDVKIRQILFNLLSNAVKFTPNGGRVGIHVSRHEDDLLIRVSDTGIGLNPADLDLVFQAFRQIDSPHLEPHEGTGLGLALSRELVELHGGQIWAESTGTGKGSTFSLSIPLVEQK